MPPTSGFGRPATAAGPELAAVESVGREREADAFPSRPQRAKGRRHDRVGDVPPPDEQQ